eukprot:4408086-Pyramimonas_sp.AAC.1
MRSKSSATQISIIDNPAVDNLGCDSLLDPEPPDCQYSTSGGAAFTFYHFRRRYFGRTFGHSRGRTFGHSRAPRQVRDGAAAVGGGAREHRRIEDRAAAAGGRRADPLPRARARNAPAGPPGGGASTGRAAPRGG